MTEQQNRLYPANYGAWAGFPAGHKPDFKRCCVEVRGKERWPKYYQCNKPRGHGPDEAYCKTHDPAAVAARAEAADARYAVERKKRMMEVYGRTFHDALRLIANGHNDAMGLARETLEKFDSHFPKQGDPDGQD